MDPAPRLPNRLWRVDYMEGFGWPTCTRREASKRTFTSASHAAEFIAMLRRWPDHHRLIAVHVATVDWQPLDPTDLPSPEKGPDNV